MYTWQVYAPQQQVGGGVTIEGEQARGKRGVALGYGFLCERHDARDLQLVGGWHKRVGRALRAG